MRRTYRSKKDSENCLDRKDVLLAMDEKSSVFDAFYIQNIKQAKRELSYMGFSNQYKATSNKVRKRKYVKRIIKDVTPDRKESSTTSTVLTPDKSIHVNKAPDLFDQLLNSSSQRAESSKSIKDGSFNKIPKCAKKIYTKRKLPKQKKYNCSSSESTESDKENTHLETSNTNQNMSDIKTHQLFIETESKNKQLNTDESIRNIENNFSFFNNLKSRQSNSNSLIKTTFRQSKNRLSKDLKSPVLQKSPFSSTPFTEKYRGKSIYKFSPIPMQDLSESPNYVTIVEENNKDNDSIIFVSNEKNNAAGNLTQDMIQSSPVTHLTRNESKCLAKTKSLVSSINVNYQSVYLDVKNNDEMRMSEKVLDEECVENKSTTGIEYSSLQIEPFLGFSNNSLIENNGNDHVSIADQKERDSLTHVGTEATLPDQASLGCNEIESSLEENCKNDRDQNTFNSVQSNVDESSDHNTCSDSQSIERESSYDTCNSEQSSNERRVDKIPLVKIIKMDDSLFQKYYKKIIDRRSDICVSDICVSDSSQNNVSYKSNSIDHSGHENCNSKDSTQFYSDQSSNKESDFEEGLNESVATNSYDSQDNSESLDSNSNDDDEQCVNFITTRRGNELTNSSIVSVFDNSFDGVSSSECDKTVLCNADNHSVPKNFDSDNNQVEDNEKVEDAVVSNDMAFKSDDECSVDKLNYKNVSLENNLENSAIIETSTSNVTQRKSSKIFSNSLHRNSEENEEKSVNITTRESNIQGTSETSTRASIIEMKPGIVLQPGKKWERSLSIYRRMTMMTDNFNSSILEDEPLDFKGRKYRQSVINTMEMQESRAGSILHNDSFNCRRSTFIAKPCRSTIKIVKESNSSRISLRKTIFDDSKGFLNEDCDDTIIELSKLSIADPEHEITILEKVHDTSSRAVNARDYVLRRCDQTDAILFDECYPDTVLKNCRKIGEGVYGEVFLWRAGDGRARVMKIVPIAGSIKVNGEHQKDYHEIISEIVIAMELSALRAPIAEIERHIDEGQDIDTLDLHSIENATDVFNEVLAVRCVYGSYPSRLLDLWDLYDECKGSENDNPAILPADQQYIVLELANAGQDLESYQFNSAEQAHALFLQVAYGLAVAEEAFQFEHRDLHWGNVLIAPTDQKYATFVVRGRAHRVARCGVAATIIDYSLSRLSLPLAGAAGGGCGPGDRAALYNDLAADEGLFDAVGDYQFEVYRLMRDKLGNDWKNFEPYTNILWLHYTVDKMITALRYKRTNTKIHKHYISKLKGIKNRILNYGSAAQFVLTDNEF